MSRYRRTSRPASRSGVRRATRRAIRLRWRAPDDLGTALACYRRAIAAHRRLARLAPRFFDSAVIERERREQEARSSYMQFWKPAFIKVYGAEPEPLSPARQLPSLPPPCTRADVEHQLASWQFWLAGGREALRRFQLRHPHALVDLSRVARLLETGFDFGRLATGLDSAQPVAKTTAHSGTCLATTETLNT